MAVELAVVDALEVADKLALDDAVESAVDVPDELADELGVVTAVSVFIDVAVVDTVLDAVDEAEDVAEDEADELADEATDDDPVEDADEETVVVTLLVPETNIVDETDVEAVELSLEVAEVEPELDPLVIAVVVAVVLIDMVDVVEAVDEAVVDAVDDTDDDLVEVCDVCSQLIKLPVEYASIARLIAPDTSSHTSRSIFNSKPMPHPISFSGSGPPPGYGPRISFATLCRTTIDLSSHSAFLANALSSGLLGLCLRKNSSLS